jgi:hypothetical protein
VGQRSNLVVANDPLRNSPLERWDQQRQGSPIAKQPVPSQTNGPLVVDGLRPLELNDAPASIHEENAMQNDVDVALDAQGLAITLLRFTHGQVRRPNDPKLTVPGGSLRSQDMHSGVGLSLFRVLHEIE